MNDKVTIYKEVSAQILAVLEGEHDTIAKMATVSCLLAETFADKYYWTGFYIVDDKKKNELIVGPYQGTLGCLRIPFGQGVCGEVAASGKTLVVEDVHAHSGHIACDHRTKSEIVVPVYDVLGHMIAVFDVDSTQKAAFDELDQKSLEALMKGVFATGDSL